MTQTTRATNAERRTGYAAPALQKGLDILELLADVGAPLSTRDLATRLGRSKNEIFRMLHVLLERGYIAREPVTEHLALTNKLFELGMQTGQMRDLMAVAAPVVERLSQDIRQSAHLVVANRGETVVIAAASGVTDMTFSLKLGYRRPLVDAHSGLLLIAFQSEATRRRMIDESMVHMSCPPDPDTVEAELDALRRTGSIVRESRDFAGVTDIACPILADDGRALACLIVAYLNRKGASPDYERVRGHVEAACREIAAGLWSIDP